MARDPLTFRFGIIFSFPQRRITPWSTLNKKMFSVVKFDYFSNHDHDIIGCLEPRVSFQGFGCLRAMRDVYPRATYVRST